MTAHPAAQPRARGGGREAKVRNERRKFARYRIPVVIDAPELSELALVPEDVSATGFRVVVSAPAEVGSSAACAIQTAEEVFPVCRGRIVWLKENRTEPRSWTLGIAVRSDGKDQTRLAGLLEELSKELGGVMIPFL